MYMPELVITQEFGGAHQGRDYGTKTPHNPPVLIAPESGRVVLARSVDPARLYSDGTKRMDRWVLIQSNDFSYFNFDHFYLFGHVSDIYVKKGQMVKRGDKLAKMGNTGYVLPQPTSSNDKTSGLHTHFEIRRGIKQEHLGTLDYPAVNPINFLNNWKDNDMTIWIKPIQKMVFQLKRGIDMYDIENNKVLHGSGHSIVVTAKTNIVHGSTFYLPEDRVKKGQAYGFKEEHLYNRDILKSVDIVKDPAPTPAKPDPKVEEEARRFREILKNLKPV